MKATLWNDGWEFWSGEKPERRALTLPHDAMLAGRRDPASLGKDAMGFFCGDVYHYEKRFLAPVDWACKRVAAAFDGVMRNATVTLNGTEVARHAYGYTPFVAELGDALVPGEENVLSVTADCSQLPCSRWYPGGGIYRDVRLLVGPERCVAWRGVRVSTVSLAPACVRVEVALEGTPLSDELLRAEILDGDAVVASGTVAPVGASAELELEVPDARLWSAETPALYACRVTLEANDVLLDTSSTSFGVRTLAWSAEEGFLVNGQKTLLRGACVHHDNGMLGAVSLAAAEERKVRLLKESGFNAIRSSHNPASEVLLAACDRLGMYVMDETFDMWFQHKNTYDYAGDFDACYLDDVRAMVERDFNHPSVVMYSIGNEVSEPAKPRGMEVARAMVDLIHGLDASRPVTAGINFMVLMMAASGKGLYDEGGMASSYANGAPDAGEKGAGAGTGSGAGKEQKSGSLIFNTMMSVLGKGMNRIGNSKKADRAASPVLDLLDVAGYNYASGRYVKEGKLHPGRIIVGSETFPQDIADNWALVEKLPYLVGDFMWTGWDYLGEAAIGAWNYQGVSMASVPYPWLLSGAGAIDICGRAGAEAAYASVAWGTREEPYIGVRPANHPGVRVTKSAWRGTNAFDSWSWAGCEGNKTLVEVYGRGATVELFVNGRGLGRKRLKKFKATYKVAYVPGTLRAVVYDLAGNPVGETELTSAEDARLRVRFEAEAERVAPGEVAYVSVEVADEKGVLESNADRRVTLSVEGGELLGFGSAQEDPAESYLSGACTLRYGHAVAVVRAGEAGELRVSVEDEAGERAAAAVEVA